MKGTLALPSGPNAFAAFAGTDVWAGSGNVMAHFDGTSWSEHTVAVGNAFIYAAGGLPGNALLVACIRECSATHFVDKARAHSPDYAGK